MKNLMCIVFSMVAFTLATFSCTPTTPPQKQIESVKTDTIKPHPVVAVNVADSLAALQLQNFVADTSYTSVQSSLASAQNFAKQVDDETYRASLVFDRIMTKVKALETLEHQLDNALLTTKSLKPTRPTHEYLAHQYRLNRPDSSLMVGYR